MTTRTTTYASSFAGKLEVIFRGGYGASLSSDPGFPSAGGYDIQLECLVSDGGGALARTYINRASPSSHVILDYPGGSVAWTVSMSDVSRTAGGGLGSYSVTPQVSFLLVKR